MKKEDVIYNMFPRRRCKSSTALRIDMCLNKLVNLCFRIELSTDY